MQGISSHEDEKISVAIESLYNNKEKHLNWLPFF